MKRFAIAAGIVVAVIATPAGQASKPTTWVLGAGTTLCRAWLGADTFTRNADGSMTSHMTPKDPVQVSWIIGYLSAVGVNYDAPGPRVESYALGWISAACERNPDRTIASVAAELAASGR